MGLFFACAAGPAWCGKDWKNLKTSSYHKNQKKKEDKACVQYLVETLFEEKVAEDKD